MLKKFLKKEEERFDHPLYPFKTIPINSFEELMQNYNVYELTAHWYDSCPAECNICKKHSCKNCTVYDKWDGSYEQLTYNNWIDVDGPGIWGSTQKQMNNWVENSFRQEILKQEDFENRLFWYQPKDKDFFKIFYLHRDKDRFDDWFVFRRKTSPR